MLQERLELAKRGRRPFETDWYMNIGYLAGEQWINATTYDPVTRIVEIDVDGPTPVHNNFIKIARTERAKIMKVSPVPSAMPITDGDKDMYAAQIINAYYRYLMDEWKYEARLRQASYWLVATGNVFYKWYWAGNMPRMAVIPPFDLYPDPYARTFADCRWVIHQQFLDEETAMERYDIKEKDIKSMMSTAASDLTPVEARLYTNYGTAGGTLPGVVINEYWEVPSVSCPKGRLVVFAGNKILSEMAYPYQHMRLPFTHVSHVERANSKWANSTLDFIRPLQDELNRVEQQIIENRNLANGIWFIPSDVELENDITSDPRQVIPWSGPPNLNPRDWYVQVQGMANWVASEPDRIKATMQDIVAQHEVSNAGVPGRVESGQAIQLLQETDDAVIKDTIHSFEEAIADGFKQAAALYKQYGTDESLTLRVYDKNGAVQVREFHRDLIPVDLRVRCQSTTGLPNTIAGKWDRILNLVQYQLIDPQYALDLLDLSPEDPELRPETLDIRNADAENTRLTQGDPVLASMFENHAVHIERHRRYRKTAEYRDALANDPDVKARFDAHELSHFDEWKKQMALETEIQQMANPPAPEEGGDASGAPAPEPPPPAPNGGPAPVA